MAYKTLDDFPPLDSWPGYKAATRALWDRHPVFLCAGLSLIMTEPIGRNWQARLRALAVTAKQAAAFVLLAQKPKLQNLPRADILLFHSSNKPNVQPATDLLARRLAEAGYTCAVLSRTSLRLWKCDTAGKVEVDIVPSYEHWVRFGLGKMTALRLCLKVAHLTRFLVEELRTEPTVRSRVVANVLDVWLYLLLSSHHLLLSKLLLTQIKPRLLMVNQERVPIAAELLWQAKTRSGIQTVYFCNEHVSGMFEPMLSDELWVWNETMLREVERVLANYYHPRMTVIGHAETDAVLRPSDTSNDVPNERSTRLQLRTDGKPVFLFLSEYSPGSIWYVGDITLSEATARALAWIEYAAEQCREWVFVVKTRPLQPTLEIPTLAEALARQSNLLSSAGDVTYPEFLTWSNLVAVGSLSTTGLMAASGVGKAALRMIVPGSDYSLPVIDSISRVIRTPEVLVTALCELEAAYRAGDSLAQTCMPFEVGAFFPYRGAVLDRMADRALSLLANGSGQ